MASHTGIFNSKWFLLLISFFLVIPAGDAHSQEWRQTASVITPVDGTVSPNDPQMGSRGTLYALLDSVATLEESMAASDSERSVRVKRSPSADKKISIPMLREMLLNEEGLGLVGSATHAIIDYDFEFDGRSNFQETVRGIQFIFRPSAGEEDISILYLNGQDEWVQKILDHTGPPPPQNLDATILFRERLHFTDVVDDPEAQLVEINERTVRKGFEKKKREFVERVHWLTQEFLSE